MMPLLLRFYRFHIRGIYTLNSSMTFAVPTSILEEELRLQKARVADRDHLIRTLTHRVFSLEAEIGALQDQLVGAIEATKAEAYKRQGGSRDAATNTGSDWVVWHETSWMMLESEAHYRRSITGEYAEWFALALAERWHFDSIAVVQRGLQWALAAVADVFPHAGVTPYPSEGQQATTSAALSLSPRWGGPGGATLKHSEVSSSPGVVLTDVYLVGSTHHLDATNKCHPARAGSRAASAHHTFNTSFVSPLDHSQTSRRPALSPGRGPSRRIFGHDGDVGSMSPSAFVLHHMFTTTSLLQQHIDRQVDSLKSYVAAQQQRSAESLEKQVRLATERCSLLVDEAFHRNELYELCVDQANTLLMKVIHASEVRLLAAQVKGLLKENAAMLDFGMGEACNSHMARSELESVVTVCQQSVAVEQTRRLVSAEECGHALIGLSEASEWSQLSSKQELAHEKIMLDQQRRQLVEYLRSADASLRQESEPHQRDIIRSSEASEFMNMGRVHRQWVEDHVAFQRHILRKERHVFEECVTSCLFEVVHPLLLDAGRSFWNFLRIDILPSLLHVQDSAERRTRRAMRQQFDVATEALDERLQLQSDSSRDIGRVGLSMHRERRLLELREQRGAEASFVFHHATIAAADCLEDVKRSTADLYSCLVSDLGKLAHDATMTQRRYARRVTLHQQHRTSMMDQEAQGRRFLEVWEAEHVFERILMPLHAASVANKIRAENDGLIASIESDTIAIVRDVMSREQKLVATFADKSLLPLHVHASHMLLELHADFASYMAGFVRNDVSLSEKRWKHRASADANRQISAASSTVSTTLERSYEDSLMLFVNLREELEAGYRQRLSLTLRSEQSRLARFGCEAVVQFVSDRQDMLLQYVAEGFRGRDELLCAKHDSSLRAVLEGGVVERIRHMQAHEAAYCANLVGEGLVLARRMGEECHHATFEMLSMQMQLHHARRTGPVAEREEMKRALHASEQYIAIAERQKLLIELHQARHDELMRTEQREMMSLILIFARGLVSLARSDRLLRDALSAAGGNIHHTAQALAGRAGVAVEASLVQGSPTAPMMEGRQRSSSPPSTFRHYSTAAVAASALSSAGAEGRRRIGLVAPAMDSPTLSTGSHSPEVNPQEVRRRLEELVASPTTTARGGSSGTSSVSASIDRRLEALFGSPLTRREGGDASAGRGGGL